LSKVSAILRQMDFNPDLVLSCFFFITPLAFLMGISVSQGHGLENVYIVWIYLSRVYRHRCRKNNKTHEPLQYLKKKMTCPGPWIKLKKTLALTHMICYFFVHQKCVNKFIITIRYTIYFSHFGLISAFRDKLKLKLMDIKGG